MRQASKNDVDFWGLAICSYLVNNAWVGLALSILALYPLYKSIKERDEQSETNLDNARWGEHGCSNGACEQSCQREQQDNSSKASKVSSKE